MCLYLFIPCAVSSEPLLVYQIPRRTKGGIFLLTSDPTASPAAVVGGDGVYAYKPDNTENLNRSEQLWLLNALGSLLFYLFKIVLSLSCCWKKNEKDEFDGDIFFFVWSADLEACVWLEETLKNFDRILVVISHSQDFLNGVCTNIIHMQNKKLKIYTGNYDQYVQTRSELEENQMKQYKWEQEQISSMKEYIARFGHGSAKLARQAQSKEKTLAKMERGGLTERVVRDKVLVFRFVDVGKLPPPVLQFVEVTFGYTPDNLIYKNIDFGVDLDSRIALVGPNGAGKSTLLKLMTGDLFPIDGMVRRHNHLRIAQFHQHLTEKLDMELPALQFMMREYPGTEEEKMRAAIGKFGLSGKAQVMPMKNLSDGQRSRVIFAWLAYRQPHLLLLDEPTNHLDIETIDSLAEALNEWDGGLVLVSHDFRLINQVAHEIWVCENQAVTRWGGDIMDFKAHLKKKAGLSD